MSRREPTWTGPGSELWHGDALELIRDVGKVDAVITDPPYSSGARSDANRQWKNPATAMQIKDVDWFSHDQMTTWGRESNLRRAGSRPPATGSPAFPARSSRTGTDRVTLQRTGPRTSSRARRRKTMTKPRNRCHGQPGWARSNHRWQRAMLEDGDGVSLKKGDELQRCGYCKMLRVVRPQSYHARRYSVIRQWEKGSEPSR